MRRSSIPAVAVLMLITAGAWVSTQDQTAPQGGAQPTFRTGVNIVRVDVIVTDKSGNPVADLTKDEFEIVEEGRTQTIDLFRQIRIDGTPDPSRPRQVLTRDTEELEAAREDVRIFGILLADYQVCAERSRLVREALTTFIRKLGPNDLVAVMSPLTSVRDLLFTYDHDAVLNTIQRFEGRRGDYTPRNLVEQEHAQQVGSVERIRHLVVRDALKALAVRLGSMREGRKSVIFVSEGFRYADPQGLREIAQEFNRHNGSIYPIDPRGLIAGDGDLSATIRPGCGRTSPMGLRLSQDTLRELADETEGRAMVNRNALADGLGQLLRDSSFHYLLGYSSTAAQADGKFHQIRVRVKRDKVDVRARKGYWASTAEDVSRAANPVPGIPQPILDALAAIAAPNQDGRLMRTWMGVGRGADGKGRVTIVSEPLAAAGGVARKESPARLTITATRLRAETVFENPPADLSAGTSQRISFDVPAGSLEIKMVIADREGNTIDRETRVIEVPDYSGRTAALGTLRFYQGRTVREFQTLLADADAIPVAARDFARTERLLIRFDAYAPGGAPASPKAAILNRSGRKMFDVPVTDATAGASHQIDLALSPLPPGEYLLEVVATPTGVVATPAGVVATPAGPRQLAAFRIR